MIKVTANKGKGKITPFPKLMISQNNTILLVTEINKDANHLMAGIVLKSKFARIGTYGVDWIRDLFQDYNGEVTLKNTNKSA